MVTAAGGGIGLGMANWEIAECFHRDYAARNGVDCSNRGLAKGLERLPPLSGSGRSDASGHAGRSDGDLRNTHDEVPVRDGPKHVSAEPLAEFHDTLLMVGWAEVPSLAGECEDPSFPNRSHRILAKPLSTSARSGHPDDHLPETGVPGAVALPEFLPVNLLKGLEVIPYALVVRGEMGHPPDKRRNRDLLDSVPNRGPRLYKNADTHLRI